MADLEAEADPEPGTVNEARTKGCCIYCEEVSPYDPSWTYRSACPKCGEEMFAYTCENCDMITECRTSDDPPGIPSFPNHPCDSCGQTREEQEAEEQEWQHFTDEKERVQAAYEYRNRVKRRIYQNAINHTLTSRYEMNHVKALHAMRNPKSEDDALRMVSGWKKLRPFVVEEFKKRNLNPEEMITTQWCKHVLTYFERCWLAENEEGLESGVVEDRTGNLYFSLLDRETTVKLRELREGHAEEGAFPCCPAVAITINQEEGEDKKDGGSLKVNWDPDPEPGSDPREIYQKDGDRRLCLEEFILWSARFGGLGGGDYNPKYVIECDSKHYPEPIAYVPSLWVGRPQSWRKEVESGYSHWRFWMTGDVFEWNTDRLLSPAELLSLSEKNMRRCCVCYGLPPNGKELIGCDCGDRLYCSQEHKEQYMKIHKFHPTLRHKASIFVCLNCGKESKSLSRCSKCKNAFFCNQDCQKRIWPSHKEQCMPCG